MNQNNKNNNRVYPNFDPKSEVKSLGLTKFFKPDLPPEKVRTILDQISESFMDNYNPLQAKNMGWAGLAMGDIERLIGSGS